MAICSAGINFFNGRSERHQLSVAALGMLAGTMAFSGRPAVRVGAMLGIGASAIALSTLGNSISELQFERPQTLSSQASLDARHARDLVGAKRPMLRERMTSLSILSPIRWQQPSSASHAAASVNNPTSDTRRAMQVRQSNFKASSEQKVRGLVDQLSHQKAALNAAGVENEALRRWLVNARDQNRVLCEQTQSDQETIARLREEIAHVTEVARAAIQPLAEEIYDLGTKNDSLKSRLRQVIAETASQQYTILALREKNDSLQSNFSRIEQMLLNQESENAKLLAACADRQELSEENDMLTQRALLQNSNYNVLRGQNTDLRQENLALNNELKSSDAALLSVMNKTQQTVRHLQAEIRKLEREKKLLVATVKLQLEYSQAESELLKSGHYVLQISQPSEAGSKEREEVLKAQLHAINLSPN